MKTFRLTTIIGLALVLVSLSACQTLTGRSTGRYIDDKTITAEVKAKLVGEKASNLTRIGVNTTNGIVTLTGVADTFDDKTRAEQIAAGVGGVRQIQNQVQVRTTPAASPR